MGTGLLAGVDSGQVLVRAVAFVGEFQTAAIIVLSLCLAGLVVSLLSRMGG